MRILVVEDDELLGDGLCQGLGHFGHTVDWLKDGKSAAAAILTQSFDAVVLDLGLPQQSGLDVLKDVRAENIATPILILTARESVEDRVKGLDSGADDYLTKPFDLDELAARIRALQRRVTSRATPQISHGDIVLDPASHSVTKAGTEIEMSRREFALLQKLLENAGQVLSRESLTQSLYGWEDDVESNAIEVHIHNLRKKLGNDVISTIRGIGYIVERDQ